MTTLPKENLSQCATCHGELWVCENHPAVPWNAGDPPCCGGAGMPCPACNTPKDGSMARPMPGSVVIDLLAADRKCPRADGCNRPKDCEAAGYCLHMASVKLTGWEMQEDAW